MLYGLRIYTVEDPKIRLSSSKHCFTVVCQGLIVGAAREEEEEYHRRNSTGGIPPVKCRPLADKSCTSGAIWRIDHALVAPPGGQVTNK